MAIYVGIHKFSENTEEEVISKAWSKYKEVCEEKGAKAIRLGYSLEKGEGHCITEASSEDLVREAHEAIEQKPEDIYEIQIKD